MKPSWRKPAGAIAILLLIAIWAALIATIAPRTGSWPFVAEILFYLIAGIAWILPLRPLLLWMETGKWRE